jgi:hypothetical protein
MSVDISIIYTIPRKATCMSERAHELVDSYDIDPELIEGVLLRYGADVDVPEPDDLDSVHREVYEFLADEESIRAAGDHFYQFDSHTEYGTRSDAPSTEPDFEAVLDDLVEAGLVARTAEDRPRYSASFYNLLGEVGPNFTATELDQFCAASGTDKRAVYYHILGSLELDLDLGR